MNTSVSMLSGVEEDKLPIYEGLVMVYLGRLIDLELENEAYTKASQRGVVFVSMDFGSWGCDYHWYYSKHQHACSEQDGVKALEGAMDMDFKHTHDYTTVGWLRWGIDSNNPVFAFFKTTEDAVDFMENM